MGFLPFTSLVISQTSLLLGPIYQEDIMAFLRKPMEGAEEVECTAALTVLREVTQERK